MAPSSAPGWLGAPPVSEDGFAFANGEFFAEASGRNRHRRATQAELKAHFASGNEKDHPAHWFEAQLIHYGLQPSKTKSVARMRLFDAVNGAKLTVPTHIVKLEGKLKKDWTKKDREAKKAAKGASVAEPKQTKTTDKTATDKKTAGVKRKPDAGISANDSSGPPAAERAKNAAPKKTPASEAPPPAPAKKQTARCRRGGVSQGPSRGSSTTLAAEPYPARPPRTKQTARRGRPFVPPGRIPAPASHINDYDNYAHFDSDEAPPPYSEYDEDSDDDDDDDDDDDGDGDDTYGNKLSLAPLGLLNGRYDITSHYVSSEWPHHGHEFDIVFILSGSSLWGSFDLGVIEGVLRFDERPFQSSHDPVPFKWRGREDEGPILFGDGNRGWIKFLGNGRIEGCFDFMQVTFRGERLPGQGTKSEIDARSLQHEWNGYSEEKYERENRARWG